MDINKILNPINEEIGLIEKPRTEDIELEKLEKLVLCTNLLIHQRASVVKDLPMLIEFQDSINKMEKSGVISEASFDKLAKLKDMLSITVRNGPI